jgi:hypothetical protein
MENRKVDVLEMINNPDGTATVKFDFTEEEISHFFRLGVIEAIKNGIKEAEQYNPDDTLRKNKHTFDMTWDQVDSIIIKELCSAYDSSLNDNDEYYKNLRQSLDTVLKHFMPASKYQTWKSKVGT